MAGFSGIFFAVSPPCTLPRGLAELDNPAAITRLGNYNEAFMTNNSKAMSGHTDVRAVSFIEGLKDLAKGSKTAILKVRPHSNGRLSIHMIELGLDEYGLIDPAEVQWAVDELVEQTNGEPLM